MIDKENWNYIIPKGPYRSVALLDLQKDFSFEWSCHESLLSFENDHLKTGIVGYKNVFSIDGTPCNNDSGQNISVKWNNSYLKNLKSLTISSACCTYKQFCTKN